MQKLSKEQINALANKVIKTQNEEYNKQIEKIEKDFQPKINALAIKLEKELSKLSPELIEYLDSNSYGRIDIENCKDMASNILSEKLKNLFEKVPIKKQKFQDVVDNIHLLTIDATDLQDLYSKLGMTQ